MRDDPTLHPAAARIAAGAPLAHDSAHKHVSGEALYTDDLPELPGTLHAYVLQSVRPHARIVRLDASRARAAPGVHAVVTAEDVPGELDIGAAGPGDPLLASGLVEYVGQAVAAVAARTVEEARQAASLIEVEYEDLPALLTAEEALAAGSFIGPSLTMRLGNSAEALMAAPHRLRGTVDVGGQDHFYLEGQIAYALPHEDGDLLVHSSTQHPSEVQHLIAKVLGKPHANVTVEIRRMGGGFGGKETQPALIACIASLLAHVTGRPVKYRMDRDDDMVMTGKRHDFHIRYDVGFDDRGRIQGIEMELAARCGMSPDLSNAVVDRAMFHADNAYFLGNATVTGHRCKTHTVSNTAFRGFGGPQGMAAIEYVVDEIARHLKQDPLDIRWRNLYGKTDRNLTHYHQTVEDNILPELLDELETSSGYRLRRAEVDAFNARHGVLKKGLALTPVKFGISFTTTHLNQAGALLHVYSDGSVQLNHGGTEMGQGLHVKVAQLVASELGIDVSRIRITATTTGKVPNTSATAASSGTDLNGAAAITAARQIRNRMTGFLAEHCHTTPDRVRFRDDVVQVGDQVFSFRDACRLCHLNRIHLSAAGYYRTPKIWWSRDEARGRPFYYFAYGAAVTEVLVDTLTGEYRFVRADILHDCGSSINPAVDIGQVEGGYVQGLGWLTMEELWWDAQGRLRTHAPSTYKIPTARDVPADLQVRLVANRPNREDVVYRSKAVGEPPLMLGIGAWLALKDAVAAVGGHRLPVHLDAPATPERVLLACEALRRRMDASAPARALPTDAAAGHL